MNSLAEPKKWEKFFWPLLATALFLALWHYSVAWTATKIFPSPLDVKKGIAELIRKQVLWRDILDSLRRVAIGFGAATLIGIPLGLTLGWYPAANHVVNPVLQILRPVSPIAWIPVAIILLGVGDHAATSLIFLGALFPIIVASVDGVSNVPSVFRLAGRNSGKRYDLVVAAMLIIGLIGLILDTGFRRLEKIKSVRWGFRDDS
jgi:NitT/TauT family transport system permease protein